MKNVSLEHESQRDEQGSLCGKPSDGVDWEMVDTDMEALTGALKEWRKWAMNILSYYLAGQKRSWTKLISEQYGVLEQTVWAWKRKFEVFTLEILKVSSGSFC